MVAPTPEQIQYMLDHIDESLVASIHISSGICVGVTFFSLVLRVISRRYISAAFAKDDYSILVGFAFYVAYITGLGFSTRYGQGRHVLLVTNVKAFAINNIINMSLYVAGMVCVKCSILMLYDRIFRVPAFRKALIALAAFIAAWALTAFFASIFNCYPISSAWDPTIRGRCIDYGKVTLVIGILNVLVDFTMLVYPIPMVWNLNMSTRRKFLLSLTFAAGCCACVISIARLFYARRVASTYDPSWDNVYGGILSGLEIATGIIACSIITYRPLVEKVFGKGNTTRGASAKGSRSSLSANRQGWNKITVQQDVELVSHHDT
ncbi:hypothetical protein K458DRAFT_423648 [Lentithecium fluviatile CBS 122367]|uniref:Rhodopsin domain-containing protein n=1 Tax=Lentithecium fluviatile CBS 122367 TaxID=1168545 RepID=A0A6G1IIS2_9PLEO|nr:hypothetical protein K458DRAFT_423648 [Lentithecium fluviatile CBS 122367]